MGNSMSIFGPRSLAGLLHVSKDKQDGVAKNNPGGKLRDHWEGNQADFVSSSCSKLISRVNSTEYRSMYTAWYNTDLEENGAGICFSDSYITLEDGLLNFDSNDWSRNFYMEIPHCVGRDPFVEAAWGRGSLFPRRHYFNAPDCFMAHICAGTLAIRGSNAPVMIFAYGEGGRGKSLRSKLLHTSMGKGGRGYVGPDVFYMEEELRKSGSTKSTLAFATFQDLANGSKSVMTSHCFRKWRTMEAM